MVLGDTHGNNMQIAPHLLMKYHIDKCESAKAILHVGDFGIGFSSYEGDLANLYILNDRLKKYNTFLYVIRGNHDNPEWFNNPEYMETIRNNEMIENVIFVPDHTVLTLNTTDRKEPVKVYCNGGAISIDRTKRIHGKSYWMDEKFKCLTKEQLDEIPNDLDIIITHTRPEGVWPVDKNNIEYWLLRDMGLERDLEIEGDYMKRMFDAIREKQNSYVHFYGHFHTSHEETFETENKRYVHRCLDIDELWEVRTDRLIKK